jgi:hypothetical protein
VKEQRKVRNGLGMKIQNKLLPDEFQLAFPLVHTQGRHTIQLLISYVHLKEASSSWSEGIH